MEQNKYKKVEQEYRDYVYGAYTALREKGLEKLRDLIFESNNVGNQRILDILQQLIAYFQSNLTYSLSPGVKAKNQDFCEYFLFDAKKGYCSHFASAATLLLRNHGIPARYVEGYTVQMSEASSNGESTRSIVVTDRSAHAWIEVYFDEVGWLPIEVTNGYSDGPIEINPSEEAARPTNLPTEDELTPSEGAKNGRAHD